MTTEAIYDERGVYVAPPQHVPDPRPAGPWDRNERNDNMTTVCAWCKRTLRQGDPAQPISHGICEDCAKEW